MANAEIKMREAIREVIAADTGLSGSELNRIVSWVYSNAYYWDVGYVDKAPAFPPLRHSLKYRDKKYSNLWNAVNDFIKEDPDVTRLRIQDPRDLASTIFEYIVYWQETYYKEIAAYDSEYAQETENVAWLIDATGYYTDTGAENAGS